MNENAQDRRAEAQKEEVVDAGESVPSVRDQSEHNSQVKLLPDGDVPLGLPGL